MTGYTVECVLYILILYLANSEEVIVITGRVARGWCEVEIAKMSN